jgi:hypothetical protein
MTVRKKSERTERLAPVGVNRPKRKIKRDLDEFEKMKKRYLINYISADSVTVMRSLDKLTKAQLLSIIRFEMRQHDRVDRISEKESCTNIYDLVHNIKPWDDTEKTWKDVPPSPSKVHAWVVETPPNWWTRLFTPSKWWGW